WMTCVDPKISAPKARAEAQRAVELDPSSPMAHVASSNIAYTFDADAERSLEEARRAVALGPASNDAWTNLFQRLDLLGHYDEAIGTIQRVAELDPAMATSLSM